MYLLALQFFNRQKLCVSHDLCCLWKYVHFPVMFTTDQYQPLWGKQQTQGLVFFCAHTPLIRGPRLFQLASSLCPRASFAIPRLICLWLVLKPCDPLLTCATSLLIMAHSTPLGYLTALGLSNQMPLLSVTISHFPCACARSTDTSYSFVLVPWWVSVCVPAQIANAVYMHLFLCVSIRSVI